MPVDNHSTGPGARLRDLGLVFPSPPTPLGAYVEASEVGSLLFLGGTLPVVTGKLVISWFRAAEYLTGCKAMTDSQTVRSHPGMRLRPSSASR